MKATSVGQKLITLAFALLVAAAGILAVWPLLGSVGLGPSSAEAPDHGSTSDLAYRAEIVTYSDNRVSGLGQAALEQLTYPWQDQLEGWTIEFLAAEGDVAGYTWSREQRIEVFVRPGDDAASLARVLAHELGHAVDVTLNDGDERRIWLEQRDARSADWWPNSGAADFETGAGDFAEVFAVWQTGTSDFRSRLADEPSPEDLALLETMAFD